MKFATKLTFMILGIVVTFAAIVSYVVYTSNIETLEKEIKGRLEDTAFHTMDKIDRMLFERYADIRVIAADPVISSRDSTPKEITRRLIVYRNYYKAYISLSLFDLNRIALADTAGLNIGDQDIIHGFWKDVIQGKTSAASSIELSKSLRTTVIYFASPVKDKNGEIFAVVVARIPLSKLYYVVREAGGIQEGHEELKIDLVDKDGLLLYSNYNRGGILKNNLSDWEVMQRVKAGKQRGSKRHKHLGKEETIYAFAKEQGYLDFKGNDWTLLLHIPTKVAFAPAVQLRNRMIAILSVIIVLTIVISLIFSRTISGPIINLKNTTVEIGKGKLDTKIEIASRDEIGELAASFNDMAKKLRQSHAHLEEKVQERTSELSDEVVERSGAQEKLQQHVKQLNCFYGLSKLVERPKISLEQIFQETAYLICNAHQYPDITRVRITFDGIQYKTDNFDKSELSQHADIKVRGDKAGAIEVYYLGERAEGSESPFLKEERDLLDAVAKHLGRVAERKQTREKLQLFQDLMDRSNDCIFIIEPKWGRFLDVNDRACESLGYAREELLDMTLKDIEELIPDDSSWQEYSKELELKGDIIKQGRHRCKDGTTFFTETGLKYVSQKKGDYILAIARDITERKRAEERQAGLLKEVKSVNQELKDFAYIVSHDLKAPLRGIKTLANWMSTDYADKLDEEGREQMNLLLTRVDRMHNLIDGVLAYSRVGRVKEEQIQVNLNELVPEVIDMVAPPENIEIVVENELPVIECEETRIMQVFQNLLSNAVKYMDKPKGQIKIDCVEEDGFWKFSVADNGPGIEEEHFEKIFKIFQTLSPRDEFESTGVGLTVVKKIVEMYGGRIWVESKPGEGSTFFFTLPKQKMGVKDAKYEADIVSRR